MEGEKRYPAPTPSPPSPTPPVPEPEIVGWSQRLDDWAGGTELTQKDAQKLRNVLFTLFGKSDSLEQFYA